jgi:hypothetical protein
VPAAVERDTQHAGANHLSREPAHPAADLGDAAHTPAEGRFFPSEIPIGHERKMGPVKRLVQ